MNQSIAQQFPILSRKINDTKLTYLDNAATTHKPFAVIEAITDFYSSHNANIHRGIHTLSNEATTMWETAHQTAADFINAESPEEVIFIRNTTEGLNLIANTYGEQMLEEGDVVAISEMEHHSNIIPWQMLEKRKGIKIEWIPVTNDFSLDLEYLDFMIRKYKEKLKIVSLVHISNVLGAKNPLKQISKKVHEVGGVVIADAAQSIAHTKVDVQELGVDFLVFSGHKIYAPTGSGVVWGKKAILDELEPWMGGGNMIKSVTKNGAEWNDLPMKFEAGTPNIAGGVGLGTALEWMSETLENNGGWNSYEKHETELIKATTEALLEIPKVKIFGTDDPRKRFDLVSFEIEGVHAHDISGYLDENGIAIRAGMHCAQPIHDKFGFENTARVSFGIYNTLEDVEIFIEKLREAIDILG